MFLRHGFTVCKNRINKIFKSGGPLFCLQKIGYLIH